MNRLTSTISNSWVWLAALFLILLSARLELLHSYASSTPFFDDWDMGVFIHKFHSGELSFIDWITPAYQHQLLFSKFINVVLFDINNEQWDTLNVLVFNSLLWCLTAIFIVNFAWQNTNERPSLRPVLVLFVVGLWLLPISIEAATWAIVTHYYFMMLLMLIAYSSISARPCSVRWFISLTTLLLCSLTIGAGVFAGIPLLIIFAWKIWAYPDLRSESKRTFFALIVVFILALSTTWLWQLAESSNDHYKVKSLSEFFDTLLKTLAWPSRGNDWLAVILHAPSFILLGSVLFKRIDLNPLVTFSLAIAGYMMMQSIGIAAVRNDATGINPAVRYYEFLLLSLIANFMAILCLLIQGPIADKINLKVALFFLWFVAIYSSIPAQYKIYQGVAAEELTRRAAQTHSARGYVGTGNLELLEGHPYFNIAFPRSPERLAAWLDKYKEQNTLAFELQVPERLKLQPGSVFDRNAAVQPNLNIVGSRYLGETSLGSFNNRFGAQNATGEYESQAFNINRPYVMIPTLGFLGVNATKNNLKLELVELETGSVTPVATRQKVKNSEVWQHNIVPTPKGNFLIRASDQSSQLWFAFASPREVGLVSAFVRQLIDARYKFLNLGIILLILFSSICLIIRLERQKNDL